MSEKTISVLLSCVIALVPIFVLPISGISAEFSKNLFLAASVVCIVFLSCLHSLRAKTLPIPKNPIVAIVCAIAVWGVVSSVFSGSFRQSFFGNGEAGTAFSMLLFASLTFLIAVFINTKQRATTAILMFVASSAFVLLFQLLHFIFPNGTSLGGALTEKTQNLIGQWSDFGIFSGLILLLSVVAIETLSESTKVSRIFLYSLCALAFFFHAAAPYSFSWILIFVFSGAFAIYGFLQKKKVFASGAIAALSLAMIFAGPLVAEKIFEIFQLPPNTEIRPSFQVTSDIAAENMQSGVKTALLGEGPNRFFIVWRKFHPADVNMTNVWNVDFNQGSSFIMTSVVTTGVVGLFLWAFFFGILMRAGGAMVRKERKGASSFSRFFHLASFAGTVFLWSAIICNSPGNTIIALTFIFTGFFVSALFLSNLYPIHSYELFPDSKNGHFVLVFIMAFTCITAVLGYEIYGISRSVFLYRKAMISSATGDLENAETAVSRALKYSKDDAYYRSLSALYGFHAQKILQEKEISQDEMRLRWSELYNSSIENAEMAVLADPYNYQNLMSLGNAHAALVPLKMKDISENAFKEAEGKYLLAQKTNPKNPSIFLSLAELNAAAGKKDGAIGYAKEALSLKSDYAEALSLLAELEGAVKKK